MLRPFRVLVLAFLLSCQGQKKAADRAQERLKKSEVEKAEKKKVAEEKDAKRLENKPAEVVRVGTPWDDGQVLSDEGPCPDGTWALFKGAAPGKDAAEKKANEAQRATLAKQVLEKTYLVRLRPPEQVKLSAFDAAKGTFQIDVNGSIECNDSFGHVTVAWTNAKAGNPAASALKAGDDVFAQNAWLAPPMTFTQPIKSMSEAKEWEKANRIGLSARAVFKFGKVEIDRKLKHVAKVSEKVQGEEISIGGGSEDWGAGRLVRAELIGLRVAIEQEKTQLFEKRGSTP